MQDLKTLITLDGVLVKVVITPTETGFAIKAPPAFGMPTADQLLPEDRERIEFDINDLRKSEGNEEPQTGAMAPKEKKMERSVLNSLLEKLGIENPSKFETDRAMKKATTRLGNKGVDGLDLTDDEKDAIRELGYGWLPAVGGSGNPADALATAPAAPQANEKPPKGGKAAPKADKPAKGKPVAAAKGKPANKTPAKVNGTPAEKKPRERTGGVAIFVKAFPNKQVTVIKDALVKEIAAAGVSEASARAYIVWAKRTQAGAPNKSANPFPFVISETKNKEGVKTLQKVSNFE
jgi:hypothetical protein